MGVISSPRGRAAIGAAISVLLLLAVAEVLTFPPDEEGAAASLEDVVTRLDCEAVAELSYFNSPIRGRAATRGVSCRADGAEVHVFERAPLGDGDASDKAYALAQGGSLENIDRLLHAPTERQRGCAWLLVSDEWFLVAADRRQAEDAARDLGRSIRPVTPIAPPASYMAPGGCGG